MALHVGIVHIEQAIGAKGWMKSQPQKPLLTPARPHPVRDIQKGCIAPRLILDNPDPSWLFDYEETSAAIAGAGDSHRRIQAVSHQLGTYVNRTGTGRCLRSCRGRGKQCCCWCRSRCRGGDAGFRRDRSWLGLARCQRGHHRGHCRGTCRSGRLPCRRCRRRDCLGRRCRQCSSLPTGCRGFRGQRRCCAFLA